MTKYFVDKQGNYIGGFDEAPAPAGAVEVPLAPDDARQKWLGTAYGPIPSGPYMISKSTPWIRMSDDEAELITGAMQQAGARLKGIYDAATFLSTDDPLWATLHDMIATTLNSSTRADELLAPET